MNSLPILLGNLKTHTGVFLKNVRHKQKERSGLKIKVVRTTSSGEKSFDPSENIKTRPRMVSAKTGIGQCFIVVQTISSGEKSFNPFEIS